MDGRQYVQALALEPITSLVFHLASVFTLFFAEKKNSPVLYANRYSIYTTPLKHIDYSRRQINRCYRSHMCLLYLGCYWIVRIRNYHRTFEQRCMQHQFMFEI